MKTLIWVVAIFVVAVGSLIAFGRGDTKMVESFDVAKVNSIDHVKGNASSTVVFVEYSDFQCPACKTYYPLLLEVAKTYGDRIAFVYRHFPLKQIHFNAEPAAWASEAAARQGKFWEMHNLLFEKQSEWSTSNDLKKVFEDYALILGLDKDKFLADLDSKEVKDFVNAQRQHGLKEGLNSTPTFFLNGKKLDNPQSIDAFRILIDKALKESSNISN